MRKTFSFACLLLAAAWMLPARAAYGEAVELFRLKDPAIVESSGVAISSYSDDVLFTHNDSPPVGEQLGRFFAVGPAGETLATVDVDAATNVDWEDMARGLGADGRPALFFGDIGDNGSNRPFVTVYEVPEPRLDPTITGQALNVSPTLTRHMIYEDGPHNAETLLVHPVTGQIAIVTKVRSGRSALYVATQVLPAPLPLILKKVASVRFDQLTAADTQATGGAISPDGTRFVVRTYHQAFEWLLPDGDLVAGLATAPERISVPFTQQPEAITYTRSGDGLIVTTEGANTPVHNLPRVTG